ncbi:hypothetical protein G7054_g12694 [Neopestalotiopsis clavispora]|jgi:acetyl esterase/lipase|nr:hypothetical protein G7054_g12694 [Neopestalotiopsis clavispora]
MHNNLTYYPAPNPENATGVLVVPGGGYGYVNYDKEGIQPARWLNERGVNAWVLNYTTAGTKAAPVYPEPINEALAAVKWIRDGCSPRKLGIWGWSAGGHLSAITATHDDAHHLLDFAILAYPVISMDPCITHLGSLHNLLGHDADEQLRQSMCAETRVTKDTPPVFLFHTANDGAVPVQNALVFASAMAKHGRPFQLMILPDGPHGVGMSLEDIKLTWTDQLDRWLKTFTTADEVE